MAGAGSSADHAQPRRDARRWRCLGDKRDRGSYGPVSISGSGTNYTITLAQPINEPDRVTISIGNASIVTLTRELDVLPGDFNDDGVVNGTDLIGVHNEWLHINGAVPTIFGDINGDGLVNGTDYNDVRKQIGSVLPAAMSGASITLGAASQVAPAIVRIATTNGASQGTVASQAQPQPRAEIVLSGRGSSVRKRAKGKLINHRLIEVHSRSPKHHGHHASQGIARFKINHLGVS